MINEQFDNLIEDLKGLKMSSEEKKSVYKQALYSIAKIEAVHDEALHTYSNAQIASNKTSIKSVFVSVWESYIKEKKFIPALSIVGILVLSGGASLFAEQALPGDSLYSLKVNVNENVRGLAAVTPEAKAKFALEVTGRRLQEAATLSTRGQLTAENSEIIRQQLIKQVGQVKNQVASLASTNNLKAAQGIAVNFESSLKAHELILEKISKDQQSASSTPTDASHIGSIIAAVKTELATTTQSRVDLQAKELSTDASPEKVKTRLAELKLQIVEVKLSAQTSSLSTTTASTSAYLISQADLLVALADKNIESGAYSTALAIIQKTSQLLSDIDAVIDADSTAGIDLKAIINEALSGNNINFDLGIELKPTEGATTPVVPNDSATSTSASGTASTTVSTATTTVQAM